MSDDDQAYIDAAREIYGNLGDDLILTSGITPYPDLEIDHVSGGAWVKAYLWVPDDPDSTFVPCPVCETNLVDPRFTGADGRSVCDDCRDEADNPRREMSIPHVHFYLPHRLQELLGRDCIPIPCPYWVDRIVGPNWFWRFTRDS